MVIKYFNLVHILTILSTILLMLLFYFLLRNKKDKTKKMVVFVILLINIFQHLFKFVVWPQYYGTGFNELNTACNMCALLIIVSPFVFISKSSVLKDFIFYIGTTAGLIAVSVPYWFIGESIISFEYLRFYVCHTLLFIGSILPVLLGLHKLSLNNVYKIGFICLIALLLVLLNGLVFSFINNPTNVNAALNSFYSKNPVWALRPPEGFNGAVKLIELLSPKIFIGDETKTYTPVLWYFIPMYLLITLATLIVNIIYNIATKKKGDA